MFDPSNLEFIFSYGTISFFITLLIFPLFIKLSQKLGLATRQREVSVDGTATPVFNQFHAHKVGTPRLGGFVVVISVICIVLLSRFLSFEGLLDKSLLQRKETYLPLFTLITCGLVGFADDIFNMYGIGKKKGLDTLPKLIWLLIFSILGSYWFFYKLGIDSIHIPFWGNLQLGIWYIPIFILVLNASMHYVNITDGLDGLAPGLLMMAYGTFAAIAYFGGQYFLAAFNVTIMGALLAFLWFNVWPARIFMGDAGALGLGGTLAINALLTNSVIIYPFIGIIFVIEGLSTTLQMASRRLTGKKIFRAAPLHLHLQALGYAEQNIVMRAWIIGAVVSVLGLIIVLLS